MAPDDELDGCSIDFAETFADPDEVDATPDDQIDIDVLLGDTPPEEIEAKAAAYRELFG